MKNIRIFATGATTKDGVGLTMLLSFLRKILLTSMGNLSFSVVLVGSGRSEEKREAARNITQEIERKFKAEVYCLHQDLSKSGAAERLMEQIDAAVGEDPFDFVIDNAGFADNEVFRKMKPENIRDMMMLHMVESTMLIFYLVERMHARGRGTIIRTSSLLGLTPAPNHAPYGATKAFVNSLSYAMRIEEEIEKSGIQVVSVCFGPLDTEMINDAELYARVYSYFRIFVMKTTNAADIVAKAVLDGKQGLLIPGFRTKLLALVRFLPQPIPALTARYFMRNIPNGDPNLDRIWKIFGWFPKKNNE